MKHKILAVSVAATLAVLFGSPVMAAPQMGRRHGEYRANRLSTQGRISTVTVEGDRYRVMLDHGGYTYYVPRTAVRGRDLRVGADVRLGGIVAGDFVNVDLLAFPGEQTYVTDPYYQAVPFGSSGWMSGVVQRADRHLGYLSVREDSTGDIVKIDVRHMDLRHPVNVWGVRAGDHITINGSWERRDTFDARQIEY